MLFDKKLVHFMWSDELEGKTVFFADYISDLIERVENNNTEYCDKVTQGEAHMPFKMVNDEAYWQFAYCDPHMELKLAAEQGKTIQVKNDFTGEWVDKNVNDIYLGFADHYEIRIKPSDDE